MQHRVLGTVHVHVEPGSGEGVAMRDRVHPVPESGELVGDCRGGPQVQPGVRGQRGTDAFRQHMVEVLVGDEDRVSRRPAPPGR